LLVLVLVQRRFVLMEHNNKCENNKEFWEEKGKNA